MKKYTKAALVLLAVLALALVSCASMRPYLGTYSFNEEARNMVVQGVDWDEARDFFSENLPEFSGVLDTLIGGDLSVSLTADGKATIVFGRYATEEFDYAVNGTELVLIGDDGGEFRANFSEDFRVLWFRDTPLVKN